MRGFNVDTLHELHDDVGVSGGELATTGTYVIELGGEIVIDEAIDDCMCSTT